MKHGNVIRINHEPTGMLDVYAKHVPDMHVFKKFMGISLCL